jgi:hypothetical protein
MIQQPRPQFSTPLTKALKQTVSVPFVGGVDDGDDGDDFDPPVLVGTSVSSATQL